MRCAKVADNILIKKAYLVDKKENMTGTRKIEITRDLSIDLKKKREEK